MPLLRHRNQPEPTDAQPMQRDDETSNSKGSLFSRRRRSTSPSDMEVPSHQINGNSNGFADGRNHRSNTRMGGLFSHHRSISSSDDSSGRGTIRTGSGSGFNSSIHGRHLNDPSIIAARQKVGDAEDAERQADRALVEARARVREAKQHVKNLEHEIEQEARMHKLKQQEAKQVSKSAKGLGRHG